MIYNTETEYYQHSLLEDTVRNGFQYSILHKDALPITIPMAKMAIYNIADDTQTGRFLSLVDVSELLGSAFVPTEGYLTTDYVVVQWCYDMKKIDGKYEQDYMIDLLTAYGFTNLRDLDGDGINDSEVDEIDYATALADTTKKYFMFVSSREVHSVPRVVSDEL